MSRSSKRRRLARCSESGGVEERLGGERRVEVEVKPIRELWVPQKSAKGLIFRAEGRIRRGKSIDLS